MCLAADAKAFGGEEPDIFQEGYTIEKKLLMYAWARFRPVPD